MITRVYLTKWERRLYDEAEPDNWMIWHPLLDIEDYLPANTPEMQRSEYASVMFKTPKREGGGSPSKPAILAFVTAMSIPGSIAEIEDVYMFPPHILNHKMDEIADEVKADVVSNLALFGITYADIIGALDVAEFIDKVELASNVISKDTAVEFANRETEFAWQP